MECNKHPTYLLGQHSHTNQRLTSHTLIEGAPHPPISGNAHRSTPPIRIGEPVGMTTFPAAPQSPAGDSDGIDQVREQSLVLPSKLVTLPDCFRDDELPWYVLILSCMIHVVSHAFFHLSSISCFFSIFLCSFLGTMQYSGFSDTSGSLHSSGRRDVQCPQGNYSRKAP